VLVVGGGPFQLDIIRAAKQLVREVWVVDRDPAAPGLMLADRGVALDFGQPELVTELTKREHFDGVMTAASDAAVPAVAASVEACGLVGINWTTARRCRDKLEAIETLARAGLRVPATRQVFDVETARREVDAVFGYPLVVKPRSGAGGRGVSIVRDASGIEAAVAKALRYAKPDEGCLIQQYLSGHSVGAEVFLWNGRLVAGYCLSDQYAQDFVSPIGHALPCDLSERAQAHVLSAVEAFCQALGASAGPLNFDLRYARDELWLVECNPRLGGNSITQLIRTAYGVDLAEATVLAALGEDPSACLTQRGALQPCAARMMVARGDGARVQMRRGLRDWTDCAEVLELEVVARHGELATSRVDEWFILGRCLVRGSTPQAAIELAGRIAADVQSAVSLVPSEP
jgi:biotin carboxylase